MRARCLRHKTRGRTPAESVQSAPPRLLLPRRGKDAARARHRLSVNSRSPRPRHGSSKYASRKRAAILRRRRNCISHLASCMPCRIFLNPSCTYRRLMPPWGSGSSRASRTFRRSLRGRRPNTCAHVHVCAAWRIATRQAFCYRLILHWPVCAAMRRAQCSARLHCSPEASTLHACLHVHVSSQRFQAKRWHILH